MAASARGLRLEGPAKEHEGNPIATLCGFRQTIMTECEVTVLLNRISHDPPVFDFVSDCIITILNQAHTESNGRTLIHIIRLVFEKATQEATRPRLFACLCRKMMEQTSSMIKDEAIKTPEGKLIVGGQLFRKYLLNRCQEDLSAAGNRKKLLPLPTWTRRPANDVHCYKPNVRVLDSSCSSANSSKCRCLGSVSCTNV
jgi:hypothetical protein